MCPCWLVFGIRRAEVRTLRHQERLVGNVRRKAGLAEDGSVALGLEPEGVLRIGLTHYNTGAEVDRLVDELRAITAGRAA